MARYRIPQNIGKVRVAKSLGGTFAVWNGKQGPGEFRILCRNRKDATALVEKINTKDHDGWIEVFQ